jgi:hypothetical protein
VTTSEYLLLYVFFFCIFAFLVSLWAKVGRKWVKKSQFCRQSEANFLSEAPESIITTPPTEIDKRVQMPLWEGHEKVQEQWQC